MGAKKIGSVGKLELQNPEVQNSFKTLRESNIGQILQHYHLVHAIDAMVQSGMADRLRKNGGVATDELLKGYDEYYGVQFLRYLSIRGMVKETNGKYSLTEKGLNLTAPVTVARMNMYNAAYGPVSQHMGSLLTKKMKYGKDVTRDGASLGKYSSLLTHHIYNHLGREAIKETGGKCVLDLGCGDGTFLVDLCRENPNVTGIGLDLSPEAIEVAKANVFKAGLADRIQFTVGDAFEPSSWPLVCSRADTFYSLGMLHENFRDGEEAVIGTLNKYAARMKGKVKSFVLSEPEVNYTEADADFFLIHIFSDQGFPRNQQEWLEVFSRSDLNCSKTIIEKNAPGMVVCYVLQAE